MILCYYMFYITRGIGPQLLNLTAIWSIERVMGPCFLDA